MPLCLGMMDMKTLSPLLLVLTLAAFHPSLASSIPDITCAYNCPILHPQQRFCDADEVLRVKILASEFIDTNDTVVQHSQSSFLRVKARALYSYKGSLFAAYRIFNFYSPSYTCTIPTLKVRDIYVIAGKVVDGTLVITSCDGLAVPFRELTPFQRAGFKSIYADECGICEIDGATTTKYIGGAMAELGEESGYWSPDGCFFNPIPSQKYGGEDCETLYSFCVPRPSDAQCSWQGTMSYNDCYTAREDTWFLMENGQPAYTCRSQCKSLVNKLERWRCVKDTKRLEKQGHDRC